MLIIDPPPEPRAWPHVDGPEYYSKYRPEVRRTENGRWQARVKEHNKLTAIPNITDLHAKPTFEFKTRRAAARAARHACKQWWKEDKIKQLATGWVMV